MGRLITFATSTNSHSINLAQKGGLLVSKEREPALRRTWVGELALSLDVYSMEGSYSFVSGVLV